MPQKDTVRIAAIGDLHYGRTTPPGSLQPLFAQISESADILALCGDLTDYGLAEEARAFVKELVPAVKIPIVAVLGNHDFESNQQDEIVKILNDAGVDDARRRDDAKSRASVSRAIKGFAGGFGRRALGPWGEDIIKKFVHEAVDEALKLESALARLRNEQLVALLHYAPIQATVEGEPLRDLSRSSAAAASKIRSRASLSPRCSTATRTTARPRAARAPTCPSTTSRASLMREVFPESAVPADRARPVTAVRGTDRRAGDRARARRGPLDGAMTKFLLFS